MGLELISLISKWDIFTGLSPIQKSITLQASKRWSPKFYENPERNVNVLDQDIFRETWISILSTPSCNFR